MKGAAVRGINVLMLLTLFFGGGREGLCFSTSMFTQKIMNSKIDTEQVVWVEPPKQGVATTLHFFERKKNLWVQSLQSTPAVVGRRGLAEWGAKREGDGKTPQGLFKLGTVFGKNPVSPTKMPYELLHSDMKWIDDPRSQQYNRLVRGPTSAESFETMLRKDELYDLVMVLEYNTDPVVAGKGSAIFMHIWDGPGEGTAGCVALARPDLEKVLNWLDPAKKPRILIGDLASLESVDSKVNRH